MKQLLLPFFLLLMLASPFVVFGQVTTSTINGTVASDGKKAEGLPGATVIAIHVPTGKEYGTTTRADGRYTLPNLRVGGPYTVKVSFVGYQANEVTDIYLTLSEKYTQNFSLKEAAVDVEGLTIIAQESDVLNSDRTGAATTINSKQLKNLPTITRNTSDYYRLNPAADGNSFAGRNDQFNNFSLDGSIFNNPFGLDAATPGGQTDASPISLDAIEQIQVSVAPYDVTQSGFTGASINAVTKSGTNEFHGTAFGFFRNQNMTGKKVAGSSIIVPDLLQYQAGASIGGPIVKDKIFFFANLEIDQRQDLGSNFVADNGSNTGENVSRVLESDLQAIQTALAGIGYETGDYQGYLHNTNSVKGIFKLDFNLNKNNTFTLSYNFLDAFKDKPAHPSAIGRRGPDLTTLQFRNSGYRINNVIHSVIGEVNTLIGNKYANKVQAGYTAFRDTRDPFSTPFPVININQDGIRYIVAGHEPFSINNRLDQDVFQFTDNFSIYAGAHTFTIGTSVEAFLFNNSFNLDAYGGTFGPGYESVQFFLDSIVDTGVLAAQATAAQQTFDDRNANNTWALAETNIGQWAFYVQDEWAVNDDLTVTAGVRVDVPLYFNTQDKILENIDTTRNCCYFPFIKYFNPETGDSVFFDHTVLPQQRPLISPRIGFNYDIKGDQTMQLRGGSGLFTGRLPFVWIGNQVANPNFFFYTITSPDFKFPQVWRTNLGYDHKFEDGLIVTADFIYTKDLNSMMVRNYGIAPPSGTLPGVDNRPVYTADDRNSFANNAYVFTNTNVGQSVNFSLQAQKTWENGLFVSLAYNFLDSKDASSVEAEISSDAYDRNPANNNVNVPVLAPSLYGNRHRIVGSAYKRFEYGAMATTIGVFLEYAQGGRFSYTYSGDINGDGSPLNDLIYIPTDNEIDQMTFATADPADQTAQREALKAFLTQDEYAASRRGQYAEKYAMLSPWYSNMDLRISQDLILANEHVVQLTFNMQNLGNFINSNWGVRQFPINTQPIGVSIDGTGTPIYSFDTSLTDTFAYDFSLLSRWQAQFGVRYIF